MIVVDTNVIAYLCIPGQHTALADAAFRKKDSEWTAPFLWRSEFRNILAGCMRRGQLDRETALRTIEEAEKVLHGREFMVPSKKVLEWVGRSTCSAYDCEFVALAEDLGLPLVTTDEQILKEFPKIGIHLADFVK